MIMEIYTKVKWKIRKNRGLGIFSIVMEKNTKDNFIMMSFRDKEFIGLKMEILTMDIFIQVIDMAWGLWLNKMERLFNLRVKIQTIMKSEKVHLCLRINSNSQVNIL